MAAVPPYKHTALGRKVLRSLVPVICPPQFTHLADPIVDHMELTIGAAPSLLRKAVGAGFLTYDLGALPFHGKRAHRLTGDAAERYFASWEHGPTPIHVQFSIALNQLMSLACYEQREATDAIGYYPAAWIEEVTKKRLTVFRDDIRAQEAQILAPDPLRPEFRMDALRPRRKVGG